MQQGPAGSGGEEGEQLSTRRASPWWERPAQCREGLENQPSAHWDLPGSGQRVLSLQLWQPEHIVFHHGHGAAPGTATTEGSLCQGLHTWSFYRWQVQNPRYQRSRKSSRSSAVTGGQKLREKSHPCLHRQGTLAGRRGNQEGRS